MGDRNMKDATTDGATRRTALTGLGAMGLAALAGCLPQEGGEPADEPSAAAEETSAPEASDAGGEGSPAPEPGTDFTGWAAEKDLSVVALDLEATDREFGTRAGRLEREDRYGTWLSPGFAEDSPVFTAQPLRIDPKAEELFGGQEATRGAVTGVLVQTILEILDTPLLLEADNSRSEEVSTALTEALGIADELRPTFDELFAEVPVSGAFTPDQGLPESYGFEPREYDPDSHRMHLLQAGTAVELLELSELTGPLVLASAQGVLPITADDGRELLVRDVTFGLAIDAEGGSVLMVYTVNAAPALALEDPAALPVVAGTEVPADWQEHTVGRLGVALPPDLGEPAYSEVGFTFGQGERRCSIMRSLLAAQSPYPVTAARHVARAEVPGAELVVISAGMGMDQLLTLAVTVHLGKESVRVQLHDVTEEEGPVLAHQLIAGLQIRE